MNEKNKITNIKKCTKLKFDTAKEYCNKHKIEIILGSLLVCTMGYAIITKNKNRKLDTLLNEKMKQNEYLKSQCINSNNKIDALKSEIIRQKNRIIDLEELCAIKDKFFNKAISESFRHGGSFGAQQMSYKKHNKLTTLNQ